MSSGILSSLSNSAKALNSYSRAVQVAGNNIANIDTPGYARQTIKTGPAQYYDSGNDIRNTGVEVLAVQHVRDTVLDAQMIAEQRNKGSLTTQRDLLQLMENTLGDNIGRLSQLNSLDSSLEDNIGSGLVKQVQDFFGGWSELAASPELETSRGVVYQRAVTLVEGFQVIDERLAGMESDIDARIQADLDTATAIIDEIAELYASINRTEVRTPGGAIELRSQRQERLEALAEYIDVTVTESEERVGMLDLTVKSESGNDVELLLGAQRYTDLVSTGGAIQAGTPPVNLDLQGGSLNGALKVRNQNLVETRAQLDAAVAQIVSSVNTAYNPTNAAGEDFFDTSGTTAATIALRSDLSAQSVRAADVGASGGNAIALAVADLNDTTFSLATGGSFEGTIRDHLLGMTTQLGENVSSIEARVDAQETVQRFLTDQRDSISGVNLDEEVTNMIRFQRSYQATSRLMRVLDEMLETLVTGL